MNLQRAVTRSPQKTKLTHKRIRIMIVILIPTWHKLSSMVWYTYWYLNTGIKIVLFPLIICVPEIRWPDMLKFHAERQSCTVSLSRRNVKSTIDCMRWTSLNGRRPWCSHRPIQSQIIQRQDAEHFVAREWALIIQQSATGCSKRNEGKHNTKKDDNRMITTWPSQPR